MANSCYQRHFGGPNSDDVQGELDAADGYLKAAAHLMVNGMFNVNSTSVDAWHALFAGIRERKVVYRDKDGVLKAVAIPLGKRIAVRDDTFRIRAYGESVDKNGKVVAKAWCEAVVQRLPEYQDPADEPEVPARKMEPDGTFSDKTGLSATNRLFGRKFQIESFRWLSASEI